MLDIGVIGVGNCGNQVARLAYKDADVPAFLINSSERDLATIDENLPMRCIGDLQGSGKDREEAMKFLKAACMELVRDEEFITFMETKQAVFVVSSMGGGTGSGIAPLLSNIIRQSFSTKDGNQMICILVGVMPKLTEGQSTQENAASYLYELYNVLERPTYMVFDNNNFAKEPTSKALEKVNAEIVEAIKVIQCRYNAPTPYDSIDEKDMKMVISTPGRLFVTSLLDVKEKDVETTSLEDLLIDRIKKSAHAELQRDGVVVMSGLITNLSPRLNEGMDTHIGKVIEFIGEPSDEYLHVSVNSQKDLPNNVCLILAGLSEIADRVDKLKDRIAEIKARHDQRETSSIGITGEEIAEMRAARKDRSGTGTASAELNLESVFEKFGV